MFRQEGYGMKETTIGFIGLGLIGGSIRVFDSCN